MMYMYFPSVNAGSRPVRVNFTAVDWLQPARIAVAAMIERGFFMGLRVSDSKYTKKS